MGKRLETTVNIATLVTCVAILGAIGQRAWMTYRSPEPATVFKEGDVLPAFHGQSLGKADRTLALVLRHDCGYCAESLPFYRTLAAMAKRETGGVQLAVVTLDDMNTATEYLRGNGLNVEAVISVPPEERSQLKVPGTPTILLIDRNRRIERVWVGRLDSVREDQVKAAAFPRLEKLTSSTISGLSASQP